MYLQEVGFLEAMRSRASERSNLKFFLCFIIQSREGLLNDEEKQ